MIIDKLEGIQNDLVRTDDNWQEWKFSELFEVLRKWMVSNPIKPDDQIKSKKLPSQTTRIKDKSDEGDH